ncbi:hypothetical protein [Deinococcus aquaedulcis]|uniref:hypothetical protein n=1 Tax=Deinococcus aquaedulcis TaxID=2840455 RepID=UPI001C83CCCD|nr:hypothetical protein [Deinococcus aquaedulcis]
MSLPVTLHMLGPTYISRGGTTVHLSAKGLALLTFLTLEGQPHHRETVAAMLWDSPRALASLRVELTKLRAAGFALGAPRSALLGIRLPTDLARWRQTPPADLDAWLGLLRGLPLSGLEDLNSPPLTAWVDRTRQRLLDEIELALQAAWSTADPRRRERLARHLDLLGLELPSSAPKPPPMEAVWQAARLALRQPQVLVLGGAAGSGRHRLVAASLDKRWVVVSVPALPSAALLFSVARVLVQQAAGAPLPHPATSPDEAVAGLTQALLRLGRPVALIIGGAERLPEALLAHLAFLLQWPLPLLVIFTVHPSQIQPSLEDLTAHLPPERLHLAEVPRLTLSALLNTLRTANTPDEPRRALYLLQQSEGWQAAALALRPQVAQAQPRAQLPSRERRLLLADLDAALPHARGPLARLAALQAPFTAAEAQLLLGPEHAALLWDALQVGVLRTAPGNLHLDLTQLEAWQAPDRDGPLMFSSELQRAALASTLPGTLRLQAREAAPAGAYAPEAAPVSAPVWRPVLGLPEPLGEPATSVWTPCGYHVVQEQGGWHVLRLGQSAQPDPGRLPWLHLQLPAGPLAYRLLHSSANTCLEWRPAPGAPASARGCPPLGQWALPQAPLPGLLSIRASDLVLSVAPWPQVELALPRPGQLFGAVPSQL